MAAQSGLGFSGIVAIQIPDDGATGEVLTKQSNDDYDYDWAVGGGGGAPDDAQYVVLSLNGTLTDERVLVAGDGIALTDGGAGGNATLDVGAGTGIIVNANDVQLDLASNLNVDHSAVVLTAGTGMTGGGDITASRTFDVVANADGSIQVNANDIQVGVLATDAQHGSRGNGTLHTAFTAGLAGFAPASGGGTVNFLRADGTWAVPPGAGDVVGPAGATDNAIARYDGATGKLIQNSGVLIDDADNLTIPNAAVLFTNDIEETTVDTGITFTANVAAAAAQGSTFFDGENWQISSPRNGLGDALVLGWDDTGDPTTPQGFVLSRTGVSGLLFMMTNAVNPQFIIGDDTNTGALFFDGNGNKDILFNGLDTGPGTAVNKQTGFGPGGIYITASAGGGQINIGAPNIGGVTYTLTLPVDDGNLGEALITDGSGNLSWSDLSTGFVTIGAPAQTITSVKTFNPFGSGVIGQNDIVIGDAVTPDYGLAQIGDSVYGRTSFNAAALDLDGSVLTFNQTLPATSNIEFAWVDGVPNIRFALAVPGVGNATYNPRSMLIAGPAVLDDTVVTVGYWQTNNNIFDNLVCDTSGQGADLGVQNDLEVEGTIFIDDIEESTVDAGVTFTANVAAAAAQGSTVFNGENWAISSPRNGLGDSLVIGWQDTGDATTPNQFCINRSGVSGFMFLMSNAATPQTIVGDNTNTSSWFLDGNGNKDIRINTLDTGPDRDNVVIFGYGGINLQDQTGDAIFIRSPAAVTGTYTLTLPDTDGTTGQILVNQDGAGTLDWEDPGITGIYPVWAEENAALAAGAFEWAFGNGASTPVDGGLTVHVPPGYTCECFAMSLRIGSGTATVQLYLNGVAQGPNGQVAIAAGQGASTTLGTPIAIVDGDFINFQTVAAAGTSAPNVVTAWLRVFPT